jgi:hypothetical protein
MYEQGQAVVYCSCAYHSRLQDVGLSLSSDWLSFAAITDIQSGRTAHDMHPELAALSSVDLKTVGVDFLEAYIHVLKASSTAMACYNKGRSIQLCT